MGVDARWAQGIALAVGVVVVVVVVRAVVVVVKVVAHDGWRGGGYAHVAMGER